VIIRRRSAVLVKAVLGSASFMYAAVASMVRITYHQLRHTNASLLISAGVDVVTLSGRLGHADKNITLGTYSHIIKSKEAQAANRMDMFYTNISPVLAKKA